MKKNVKRIAIVTTMMTLMGAFTAFANIATDSNATRKEESTSYETDSENPGNIEIGGLKSDLLGDLAGLIGGSTGDSSDNSSLVEDKEEFNGNVEPEVPADPEPEEPVEEEEPVAEPEEPVEEEPVIEPEAPIEDDEPTVEPEEEPEIIVSNSNSSSRSHSRSKSRDNEVVEVIVAETYEAPRAVLAEEPEEESVEEIVVPEYGSRAVLPKTGDNNHFDITLLAFIISAMGFAVTTGVNFKKH